MLVAESEVYRQLLKLELQTFKVYGVRTKRRLSSFGTYAPLILSGLPLLTGLLRRKKGASMGKLGSLFLIGWKAYKQFAPLFGGGKPASREGSSGTAAEEYLSNRL